MDGEGALGDELPLKIRCSSGLLDQIFVQCHCGNAKYGSTPASAITYSAVG
jgi:hypothetical protein